VHRRKFLTGAASAVLLPGSASAFVGGGMDSMFTRQKQYVATSFGMFLHFGINTFNDREVESGNENVNIFNPTDLSIDQWIATALAAKMKYAVWITKHHGGMCMFPTASVGDPTRPARSLTQTTWYAANGNYNITQQFAIKARAAGLKVGFYYSIRDGSISLQFATPAEFKTYTLLQMTELAAYKPDFFWLDGAEWWFGDTKPWASTQERADFIRGIGVPFYLNNSKVWEGTPLAPSYSSSDLRVVENSAMPSGNKVLSEQCKTMRADNKWFWSSTNNNSISAATILADLAGANSKNCAYLLNVPPDTTGQLPANMVSILNTVGASLP
jgi:alpha-L-fucosidase